MYEAEHLLMYWAFFVLIGAFTGDYNARQCLKQTINTYESHCNKSFEFCAVGFQRTQYL